MSESFPAKGSERFSAETLPERDRLDVWREFHARPVLRLDWEPRMRSDFHAGISVKRLGDVTIYEAGYSPATVRLRESNLSGNDLTT